MFEIGLKITLTKPDILWNVNVQIATVCHCAVSLHSALEWKIRRPNFQFLKIWLSSFFVKICPNCVLFLIFFARCIIQFRWNQPTQRTETVLFFINFFIHIFSSFYIKLDIFYYILLWLWCTCQQFFLFFGTVWMAIPCCIFLQQMFLQTCKHVWLDTA